MAFNLNRWSRVSDAMNTGLVTVATVPYNGPAMFSYASADDASATIAGANYFAGAVYDLAVGDLIFSAGSDTNTVLSVAAIDRLAGTITTSSTGIASSVGTSNLVDNAVTSAKMSPLLLKYATVAISAAAFNGMYATPIQLVAAGGANTLVVLQQLQLVMTYVGAAYAAGGVAAVQYANTANGAGIIASSTLAAATLHATASATFTMNPGIVALPFATTANQGLFLSNITGAFTTGDSTIVAHVWYRTIPTV